MDVEKSGSYNEIEKLAIYKFIKGQNNLLTYYGGITQVVGLLVCMHLLSQIPGVSHKFRIVRMIIPACLIMQPNGTLSRMYVQTYIRAK